MEDYGYGTVGAKITKLLVRLIEYTCSMLIYPFKTGEIVISLPYQVNMYLDHILYHFLGKSSKCDFLEDTTSIYGHIQKALQICGLNCSVCHAKYCVLFDCEKVVKPFKK